ncbi:Uncharacterised protein [Vibrio cholerae]|nr:Uncharacterised protein [Vibrio cholerae]
MNLLRFIHRNDRDVRRKGFTQLAQDPHQMTITLGQLQ